MFSRRTINGALALLMFLVTGVFAARAQEAEAPSYEPGDTFIYSNGSVERYMGEGEGAFLWQTLSGRVFVRDPNFFVPILSWQTTTTRGERILTGHPERVWPLGDRHRASFTVAGDIDLREEDESWDDATAHREVQQWRCRVGAREHLTVPAGDFDAFPIVCDRFSATTMRVLRRQTWYYAPDVGHYIRRVDVSFSSGEERTRDLLAALPERFASDARVRAILSEWREGTE